MAIEVRAARPDEMDQFGLVGAYVYAGAFGDGPDNVVSQNNRPEWTLCAFVDGRMAASYSCLPFTMRANGKAVSLGGVTAVGTLPEYQAPRVVARDHRAFACRHARARPIGRGAVGVAGRDLSALRLCAVRANWCVIASIRWMLVLPTATRDPRASYEWTRNKAMTY